MTWLEIIGASAVYIIGIVAGAYLLAGCVAFFGRKGGLEALVPVVLTWFSVIGIGAVVGLILLGRMLA